MLNKEIQRVAWIFILFTTQSTFASDINWEAIDDRDGIKVYRWEAPGSEVFAFKGETVLDASPSKVGSVLVDIDRHTEWNPNVAAAQIIKDISLTERLEYWHIETPFIIKDRDFVLHTTADFVPETGELMLVFRSIEDETVPLTDWVRGKMYESKYILAPTDGGKRTSVEFVVHVDPMGTCPKWIINFVQKNFPRQNLMALKEQVARPDIAEHPSIQAAYATLATPVRIPKFRR